MVFRFHELSEFDEAKRSCRRRLAGHNERRRKSSSDSQGEGGGSSSSRKGSTATMWEGSDNLFAGKFHYFQTFPDQINPWFQLWSMVSSSSAVISMHACVYIYIFCASSLSSVILLDQLINKVTIWNKNCM